MNPFGLIERYIERESALDGDASRLKVRGFFFSLLAIYGGQCLATAIQTQGPWNAAIWAEAIAVPLLIALCALTPFKRTGAALLCGMVVLRLAVVFPEGANHHYMLSLLFGMFALFDMRDERERAWLLGTAKWVMIVVLFYSGLQKLLHGYYGRGEYFAYQIAQSERYRMLFRLVLPASEIERLASYTLTAGDGPFRLHTSLGVLLSRVVYTVEMILPILLLQQKTRHLAVVGCVILIVMIETAAREFSFGLYFLSLTFLFAPGALTYQLRWLFLAGGGAMVLLRLLPRLGLMPEVYFW